MAAPDERPQLIPMRALVVSGAWSARLRADGVAGAIARGLRGGGAPEPDVALLDEGDGGVAAELSRVGFDERMRAARAVLIAVATLDPHTIARGAAFEIASRARQAGVPAYAVARENRLSAFDARVLDLQLVLRARAERELEAAGRRLAAVL